MSVGNMGVIEYDGGCRTGQRREIQRERGTQGEKGKEWEEKYYNFLKLF